MVKTKGSRKNALKMVKRGRSQKATTRLIFCEICFTLMLQKEGGSFVLKVFDLYSSCSLQLLYLLNYLYDEVIIVKPLSSRPANSEKYIVCLRFKMVHNLKKILDKFVDTL